MGGSVISTSFYVLAIFLLSHSNRASDGWSVTLFSLSTCQSEKQDDMSLSSRSFPGRQFLPANLYLGFSIALAVLGRVANCILPSPWAGWIPRIFPCTLCATKPTVGATQTSPSHLFLGRLNSTGLHRRHCISLLQTEKSLNEWNWAHSHTFSCLFYQISN